MNIGRFSVKLLTSMGAMEEKNYYLIIFLRLKIDGIGHNMTFPPRRKLPMGTMGETMIIIGIFPPPTEN